ncbi:MAG: diaminopimelate decarboxylase [Nitrospira bacterium HGW-Nitrospira-1]|nr:MAG: diaminopimelate decarboxylase [Nitrospira bacterium HGW-Nitrospira-1]
MHFFSYKEDELYAEDVPVRLLAEKYGTPLYIYSYKTLLRHFNAYNNAYKDFPHIVCYALKANSNGAVLRLLAKNGGGADIVSGGELFRAMKAGIPAEKIVYAGVGKKEEEIRSALMAKILMFNVESADELREIDRIAGKMRTKAPVALRINPDIDAKTHPYISTGMREHKFGISIDDALENYRLASRLKHIRVVGIQKHIGSQITKTSPFVDALKRILVLLDELNREKFDIKYLDIGGGLGITYVNEKPPVPADVAKKLLPLLKGRDITLIMEPGRSIVGNAGILVTKALYLKKSSGKEFVIVDAGMNDLMRPSLYEAYHHIIPIARKKRNMIMADIVGPICESGDFLAKGRKIAKVNKGEYLSVMSAGAYGMSMSSNYNSRPSVAEVMVNGKTHSLIRKRGTYEELISNENIPGYLR